MPCVRWRPCAGTRRGASAVRGSATSRSGGQALAALGAAGRQDAAPTDGRHPRAESVAAGANELAWLIGALHGTSPPRWGFRKATLYKGKRRASQSRQEG